MSYDITLTPRKNTFNHKEFFDLICSISSAEINSNEIIYTNEYCGVSFSFDAIEIRPWHLKKFLSKFIDNEKAYLKHLQLPKFAKIPILEFHLNFFRPQYFAMQACLILTTIAKRFELDVWNPQAPYSDPHSFDKDIFLQNYAENNDNIIKAFEQKHPEFKSQKLTLASTQQFAMWDWNAYRPMIQDTFPEVFLPTIYPFHLNGKIRTGLILPSDQVSFLVPETEIVIVFDKITKKSFYKNSEDFYKILNHKKCKKWEDKFLVDIELRKDIDSFMKDSEKVPSDFELVSFDRVLDSTS